jgi:hypothetical protein
MTFALSEMRNSTVWQLYRLRERIQMDPEYQRLGNIWSIENRQLLVDTILNGFDVPKLYMHKFSKPLVKGHRTYDYAIIDGRQRLETMWSFIDGKVSLSSDFKLFRNHEQLLGDMTYKDLGLEHPELKADFDAFPLSVVLLETDDLEMIEEMFSRLNEAAPLTAPEKRNAYGGPIPAAIRKVAHEPFFTKALPFENRRYRHFDLATKFLYAEYMGRVVDTKKTKLDDFVSSFATESRSKALKFLKPTLDTVRSMSLVFSDDDPLLRQVGMVTLYYHLFRVARDGGWFLEITRKKLADFDKSRANNRRHYETGDNAHVIKDLIDFDSYAQSPNDAGAIRFRLAVMLRHVFKKPLPEGEQMAA